jgi:glycerol-3-phosphate dehydrogenase
LILKGPEFSFQTRKKNLERFEKEVFDLLIIGGGITGAGVARDAMTRGLTVALVEKKDFAWGTSSRSSKLIHGGLRYLQNFEMKLVFEALSERALLLKTTPHLVRPLPFYLPVYKKGSRSRAILSIGLWLYDLLALFRAPGFHKRLSKKAFLEEFPFIKKEGLLGGFRYFDASMWDDVLAVEVLRDASAKGAALANYVEALEPIWNEERVEGFWVRDALEQGHEESAQKKVPIRAKQVIFCGGPWTDLLGEKLDANWKSWIQPSKGLHLIFDLKRFPVPGAMVMAHPTDGRVSFIIPRPDFGSGVVIVGTTDAATPQDPEKVEIESFEVEYLLELLSLYFPDLQLTTSDILSAYTGVRPLVDSALEGDAGAGSLQKVSREHHIDEVKGGVIVVAGGKYTTFRTMAEEVVDVALKKRLKASQTNSHLKLSVTLKKPDTKAPINSFILPELVQRAQQEAREEGVEVSEKLWDRHGAEALGIAKNSKETGDQGQDVPGFPALSAQLRHCIRSEMVVHLEDFYFRRVPLYLARKDHGSHLADSLAKVWAEELGLGSKEAEDEKQLLLAEIKRRSEWEESFIHAKVTS